MSQIIIRRGYPDFSRSDVKRNICPLPKNEYLSIDKTKCSVPYPLPQIAIKKTGDSQIVNELQVALINGSWDTSDGIPSIVAEMQNTSSCSQYDETIQSENESEQDKNLSWLLNFKFQELTPIPGMSHLV
ncbi:hypothetical protein WA026_002005 [Henosepilachna vigintioctopunctata]|uniref:Uncharacterized protein n=1 Tax=Henosepilachna vigintioctopunctata TaxID=420089 RepID=A0AAW1UMU1_9CUCU